MDQDAGPAFWGKGKPISGMNYDTRFSTQGAEIRAEAHWYNNGGGTGRGSRQGQKGIPDESGHIEGPKRKRKGRTRGEQPREISARAKPKWARMIMQWR